MKYLALFFIYIYQKFLKILIPGKHCKFIPSCSEYAKEAFKKYPFIKALKLSIKRIMKCRPGTEGGYDPVP